MPSTALDGAQRWPGGESRQFRWASVSTRAASALVNDGREENPGNSAVPPSWRRGEGTWALNDGREENPGNSDHHLPAGVGEGEGRSTMAGRRIPAIRRLQYGRHAGRPDRSTMAGRRIPAFRLGRSSVRPGRSLNDGREENPGNSRPHSRGWVGVARSTMAGRRIPAIRCDRQPRLLRAGLARSTMAGRRIPAIPLAADSSGYGHDGHAQRWPGGESRQFAVGWTPTHGAPGRPLNDGREENPGNSGI